MTSRRGFLFGIGAALAAPAVVRAESLMKIWVPTPEIILPSNGLLSMSQITREAVRLFVNSNVFLQNALTQYDDSFAVSGAKVGSTLRIRLPADYRA